MWTPGIHGQRPMKDDTKNRGKVNDMKIPHWLKYGLCLLLLAVLLGGCIGLAQTDQPVSLHSAGNAVEARSLADLYEQTETEHIYRLNTIDTRGYGMDDAFMKDGYILLIMRELASMERQAGRESIMPVRKMILFPVYRPEAAVSKDMTEFEGTYDLLAGGRVLTTAWDGSYTLYDANLQPLYTEEAGIGTSVGATDAGDLWYYTKEGEFVLHREGKPVGAVRAEGLSPGSYKGTRGTKVYFSMFDQAYDDALIVVDTQDWSCGEWNILYDSYSVSSDMLYYWSDDKWYIAGLDDTLTVKAFPKKYDNESLADMDERYLIGEMAVFDYDAEVMRENLCVYDMQTGALCEEKSSRELTPYAVSVCDYDQAMLLYETHDEKLEIQGMYLWEIIGAEADGQAQTCETIDFHVDQERVDELVREIGQEYGVTVYYDQEHLTAYSSNYDLMACSDTKQLGYMLCRLKECMAEYPKGIFEEMKCDDIRNIVICLCDSHIRTDEYSIEKAAGTVTKKGDTLRMSLDVHYWADLRKTFLHENTHMMEYRMEEEMKKISRRNYVQYWYVELNAPDCPPIQSYIWERTPENMKGVYDGDPENAWYIDWYAKCTISEDEARTMENGIYSTSAHYYTSPHIDRKSRFLLGMLRQAFPCVKNSQEPVFWEQRTGIVDLYQEFPDFIGQQ